MSYFSAPLLTSKELRELGRRKYAARTDSVADHLLQPWWELLVTLCPLWLAPNVITLLGTALNVATSLSVAIYSPMATEAVPEWASLGCGLGLFAYQTLDALDAKQARRTGTTSSLGELLDHGCDSLSTVAVMIAFCCCIGMGRFPTLFLLMVLSGSAMFYCTHWEAYVTGVIRFGRFDVTETQIVIASCMIFTALCGVEVWDYKVAGWCELRLIPFLVGLVICIVVLLVKFDTICSGGAGRNGSTVAGTSVLTPIIPLAMALAPAFYLAHSWSERLYRSQPVLYATLFGLIASKITNKLIVAHMAKGEMSNVDITLLAPLAFFINGYLALGIPQRFILVVALILVTVDLVLYSLALCSLISEHQGLSMFKVSSQSRRS